MHDDKHKYIPITKDIAIPVPFGLTEEEEAYAVAKFLAFNSLESLEAEVEAYRQLMRDHEEGRTFRMEDVLRDLGIDVEDDADAGGDAA